MKLHIPRKLIYLSLATLIAAGSSYLVGLSGFDTVKAVTESRCNAGAFIYHADKTATVDDSDNNHAVAPQNAQSRPIQAGKATKATGANLIPNPDAETLSTNVPDGWQANIFGDNTSTFSVVSGYNSKHGLRTETSNYKNGDADWYYLPVAVVPGQYYKYQDVYRSNATTRGILMLKHDNGNMEYINLRNAPATDTWTEYATTFFVPEDVHQAMVYHPLADNGFLETDHFALTPAQSIGFSRALISLTFDDGWRTIHDNAFPLMQRYGITSTQYLITSYLGQAKDYMTPKDVYEMRNAGNEIASHSVTHADLTKQDDKGLTNELERSHTELDKCFGQVNGFASPYGAYSPHTNDAIKQYYQNSRTTDAGFNTADSFDSYDLVVQNMDAHTTPEQLKSWIDTAQKNHAWLILVYHEIASDRGDYARSTEDFEHDLQTIKASGIKTTTVQQAMNEILPQVKEKTK